MSMEKFKEKRMGLPKLNQFSKVRFSRQYVDMTDLDSLKHIVKCKFKNMNKKHYLSAMKKMQEASQNINLLIDTQKQIEAMVHLKPG